MSTDVREPPVWKVAAVYGGATVIVASVGFYFAMVLSYTQRRLFEDGVAPKFVFDELAPFLVPPALLAGGVVWYARRIRAKEAEP